MFKGIVVIDCPMKSHLLYKIGLITVFGFAAVRAFCAQDESGDRFFAYRSFWPEFDAMKNFGKKGVNTIAFMPSNTVNSLGEPYCKYPPFWRGDGAYDFAVLDKQFDDILVANPEAKLILIVDINSAQWLTRVMSFGHSCDADSFSTLSNSLACADWRKHTEKFFKDYLKHVEEKYGSRIRAYMIACGHTDEWIDYSDAVSSRCKIYAWQKWLKANGKPIIDPPSPVRVDSASFENFLRDPAKEGDIIDYADFCNNLIADSVISFAKIARGIVGGDKKIGAFYGYLQMYWGRTVWGGHLGYEKVFASPYFDFFVSPGIYQNRDMGEASGFMCANGTRIRYGKGWLHEIDHRTHVFNHQLSDFTRIKNVANWKNSAEDVAGLKREFSLAIINRSSMWCFDMWGKVFGTPEILETVKAAREIWGRYSDRQLESRAEIAIIADPQSALYINDRKKNFPHNFREIQAALGKIGAPSEVFSFNDIGNVDLSKYKMIVLPATYLVTPERMEILKKYAMTNGRTIVSIYAPAITDGKTLDPARVKEFCGFEYGAKGVNKKNMDGWTSVYIHDYKDATPSVLRELAKSAGAHIYIDSETPVFANEKLLCVHVKDGGKKTVYLKGKCAKVTELFTGKVVAENADKFEYEFKSPDTALFELYE